MKTTIEINGHEIVIEENEGVITVTAMKDGEVMEEFEIGTESKEEETANAGEESLQDFEDFEEEEEDEKEEMGEKEEEDFEEEQEEKEEEEEEENEEENEGKLESFQSFLKKRK